MTTNHEQEIERNLKQITKQPVPPTIDDQLLQGMTKGRRSHKRWEVAKHASLSLAALFLLFLLSVNYIPGFSNIAANIPGMERIVQLIEHDQGLQDALNNHYVQVIGESDTKEGITFTIDDIIVDKRRMVVFYTLETDKDYGDLAVRSPKLFKENGDEIDNFSVGIDRISLEENKGSAIMDFTWNEDQHFDDQMSLSVMLEEFDEDDPTESELLADTFAVTLPIDLEKIQLNETIEIGRTASIEGQNIYFEKLESFPTRQVLHLEYDRENSMDILSLTNIHLENENGQSVAEVSKISTDGNKQMVSFTSNYFQDHEELYVVLSKVMALDKGKNKVVVDVENEELLEAPDNQISLRNITKDNMFDLEDTIAIHFEVDNQKEDNTFTSFSLSGKITDQSGNTYYSSRQSESIGEYSIYLEDQVYTEPLIFEIYQYPSYIFGDIRLKVK